MNLSIGTITKKIFRFLILSSLFLIFLSPLKAFAASDYEFSLKFGQEDFIASTDAGKFDWPEGIDSDNDGNVYIADTYNHRIQKFDSSGNFITQWGSWGSDNDGLKEPNDVAVYTPPASLKALGFEDRVYVADTENNRVMVYDTDGTYIDEFSSGSYYDQTATENPDVMNYDAAIGTPYGIAVNTKGDIYVTGWFERRSEIDSVSYSVTFPPGAQVFRQLSTTSFDLIQYPGWDVKDSGNQFISKGIDTDFQGRVFIANTSGSKIQMHDNLGSKIKEWGSLGSDNQSLNWPSDVSVDNYGNVFVADKYNHRIQRFKSDGTYLSSIGEEGNSDGTFKSPAGVEVDKSGRLFVADTENNRIQVFKDIVPPTGKISITQGLYTKSTGITLKISDIVDKLGRVAQMSFKIGSGSWTGWETFTGSSKSLTLPGTEDEYIVYARFKDTAGNIATFSKSITYDKTSPINKYIQSPALSTDKSLTDSKFTVDWLGTDEGSGIAGYTIQKKIDGGSWTTIYTGTKNKAAVNTGSFGHTYYYRFKSKDSAGNESGWSGATSTVVPYDQDKMIFSSNWRTSTGLSEYFLNTLNFSNTANAYARYTAKCKGFYVLGSLAPYMGKVDIYIDNVKVKTVDLYSSSTKKVQQIFTKTWSISASHTIKIVVTGQKNSSSTGTWVDLDGLGVLY